jgi:hypothetical protein
VVQVHPGPPFKSPINTLLFSLFPFRGISLERAICQKSAKSSSRLTLPSWIAALLTPRPPALMVLNEPETSLHPSLLPALARLVGRAAAKSQVIVVTHASPLITALKKEADCHSVTLEKNFGETTIRGAKQMNLPAWHWPALRIMRSLVFARMPGAY